MDEIKVRRPRNPEAAKLDPAQPEKAVIGYMLMYPSRFLQCVMLRRVHFGDERRGEIWEILTDEIQARGNALTPSLVSDGIVRRGLMTKLEAAEFLVECQDEARNAPDPETAGTTFRDQILDYAYRRQVKRTAADLTESAGEAVSLPEVRADVQAKLFELMSFESTGSAKTLDQAIADEMQRMHEQQTGTAPGLLCGETTLDSIWNGACKGNLVIVAARPSVGKTAFATFFAVNQLWPEPTIPMRAPTCGGIWSLEMTKQEIARRIACQIAKLDLHRVGRKEFFNDEADRYMEALKRIQGVSQEGRFCVMDPTTIDGRVRPKTITDIVAEARHWRNRIKLDWIVVDYLQLIQGIRRKGESRELEVARNSQMLKQLAQELEIPVICLAQVKRPDKDRLRKRPTMNELRESGSIEQDADIIILLHNWDFIDDNKPAERAPRENAELILAKNRNGRTGRAEVDFIPKYQWFGTRTVKGDNPAFEDSRSHDFDQ